MIGAPPRPSGGVAEPVGKLPRPFWFIWAGTLVNRCGSFVMPFLTIYLTQQRQLSIAQAGGVVALWGAGGSVAAPLGGYLADHIGRQAKVPVPDGVADYRRQRRGGGDACITRQTGAKNR